MPVGYRHTTEGYWQASRLSKVMGPEPGTGAAAASPLCLPLGHTYSWKPSGPGPRRPGFCGHQPLQSTGSESHQVPTRPSLHAPRQTAGVDEEPSSRTDVRGSRRAGLGAQDSLPQKGHA